MKLSFRRREILNSFFAWETLSVDVRTCLFIFVRLLLCTFFPSCQNTTERKPGDNTKTSQLNKNDMKMEKLPGDFQYLPDMYD